ncbi:MAG: hypothetical protein U0354_01315 [Candidatus Sericytochromatia bacterium]
MKNLLLESKKIFSLKKIKRFKTYLFISSLSTLSVSCNTSGTISPYGTHCREQNKNYIYMSEAISSPDNNNISFLYINGSIENNSSFLNTYLYTVGNDGKNLKKVTLIQKKAINGEVEFDLPDTKYLSDITVALCDNNKKLIKIDNSGNKTVIGDCNKIDDFLKDNIYAPKLDYLSRDGNYVFNNNSVLVLSNSETKPLEIDKDYLNEFPDNKRISIEPISESENKVFVRISYDLNNDDYKENTFIKETKTDFSIGEIDYNNFTIKNLKSFKRSTPYDSIDVLVEKDEKIIYEKNDKFYVFDYKTKDEKNLNFADNLNSDELYTLSHFDSYFSISPTLENIIFRKIDNNNFSVLKIGINNKDRKVILTQDDLPIGDKVKYTECSRSTL